jgi:6-pyruvoyltetrahydropterin/6-carboxytetrahydropterin synthase
MAYYLLSAETTFSAAHTLPGVDMCARMHGHNWRVRVTVRFDSEGLDNSGMGVDFRVLEQSARHAVADFEHRYLNDLEAFQGGVPSAETIARTVSDRIAGQLGELAPAARVEEVELWELPQYRVVYRPS